MFTEKYNELIKLMLKKGVNIELLINEHDVVLVNVNTNAKRDAFLLFAEDYIEVIKMYDTDIIANTDTKTVEEILEDLAWEVKDCMCGRDYCSQAWLDIMVEYGILEKVVETKVTYR